MCDGGKIVDAASRAANITSTTVRVDTSMVVGLQLVSSSGNFPNGRTTFCITVITGLRYVRVVYTQASAIVTIEQSNDGSTWDRCTDTAGAESYALASSAATLTVYAFVKPGL
jgi:hypothetical protein